MIDDCGWKMVKRLPGVGPGTADGEMAAWQRGPGTANEMIAEAVALWKMRL
jgi:hypothetical protein